MMNNSQYNIDNDKLINRLLPWWLRGRRVVLLLSAITLPLKKLHDQWLQWALEKLIEAKITSQSDSLSWYLNYKLKQHFLNTNDSFNADSSINSPDCFIFNMNEWRKEQEYSRPLRTLQPTDGSFIENPDDTMVIWSRGEKAVNVECAIIRAPLINDDDSYNINQYKADILNLAKRYLTNFQPIIIIYDEKILN